MKNKSCRFITMFFFLLFIKIMFITSAFAADYEVKFRYGDSYNASFNSDITTYSTQSSIPSGYYLGGVSLEGVSNRHTYIVNKSTGEVKFKFGQSYNTSFSSDASTYSSIGSIPSGYYLGGVSLEGVSNRHTYIVNKSTGEVKLRFGQSYNTSFSSDASTYSSIGSIPSGYYLGGVSLEGVSNRHIYIVNRSTGEVKLRFGQSYNTSFSSDASTYSSIGSIPSGYYLGSAPLEGVSDRYTYIVSGGSKLGNSSPTITLSSNADQTVNSTGTVTLSGTASDPDNDVVGLSATIGGVTKTASVTGSGTYSLSWDASELVGGVYTNIQIAASDGKGGTASTTYTGKITVDKPYLLVVNGKSGAFRVDPATGDYVTASGFSVASASGQPFRSGSGDDYAPYSMTYLGNNELLVVNGYHGAFKVNATTGSFTTAPGFVFNSSFGQPFKTGSGDDYAPHSIAYTGANEILVVNGYHGAFKVNATTGSFTSATGFVFNSSSGQPFYQGSGDNYAPFAMTAMSPNELFVINGKSGIFKVNATDGSFTTATGFTVYSGVGKPFQDGSGDDYAPYTIAYITPNTLPTITLQTSDKNVIPLNSSIRLNLSVTDDVGVASTSYKVYLNGVTELTGTTLSGSGAIGNSLIYFSSTSNPAITEGSSLVIRVTATDTSGFSTTSDIAVKIDSSGATDPQTL